MENEAYSDSGEDFPDGISEGVVVNPSDLDLEVNGSQIGVSLDEAEGGEGGEKQHHHGARHAIKSKSSKVVSNVRIQDVWTLKHSGFLDASFNTAS